MWLDPSVHPPNGLDWIALLAEAVCEACEVLIAESLSGIILALVVENLK